MRRKISVRWYSVHKTETQFRFDSSPMVSDMVSNAVAVAAAHTHWYTAYRFYPPTVFSSRFHDPSALGSPIASSVHWDPLPVS